MVLDLPYLVVRIAEQVVDGLVQLLERFVPERDPRWRKAIAYALVGDLIASPVPPPFDAPLDVVVMEKLQELVPNLNKYRRIYMRIAEYMPVLEMLPNYLVAVVSAKKEAEVGRCPSSTHGSKRL